MRQIFALRSQHCVGLWLGGGARRSGRLGHILTTLRLRAISTAIIAVAGGSKSVVCYPKRYPSLSQWACQSPTQISQVIDFLGGAGEGNRTLVISLEGFCSIRIAASAGSLACRRPAHQERATRAPFCISDPICRLFHVSVNAATTYNSH